ncbi:MAG: hypothetical protein JRJ06_08835 [Deltaproteobacteria bacterium]|nr:hypothetical protein [Deltaproteobacteria bacterium]MBW1864032.1 hypothetical protein [Deltaproteobacteria bacterium]
MTETQDMSERIWESGWDGHEKAQLLRMSRLSFIEKVKWLEDAQEMIHELERRKGCSN